MVYEWGGGGMWYGVKRDLKDVRVDLPKGIKWCMSEGVICSEGVR